MQQCSQKVPVNTLRTAAALSKCGNGNDVINRVPSPRTSEGYLPAINTWLSPSDFTCQWQDVEVLAGESAGVRLRATQGYF